MGNIFAFLRDMGMSQSNSRWPWKSPIASDLFIKLDSICARIFTLSIVVVILTSSICVGILSQPTLAHLKVNYDKRICSNRLLQIALLLILFKMG